MTNAKFVSDAEGLSKALLFVVEQAKGCPPDDQLQYDKTAAAWAVSELRNLAAEIEQAAV